jgi:hypothetical protein
MDKNENLVINEDMENLNLLLQKIYNKTKCNKFLEDIIFLEQWLWTLNGNKKTELNITLKGSYDEEKIKNNILSNNSNKN